MSTDIQPTGQRLDLDAIRARADAATRAPWTADDTDLKVNTEDGRALVVLATVLLGDDDTRENHPQAMADAEFLAAARTDVPQLLDHIERLHRLIRDLADEDHCWYDHHGGCQAHGYLSLEPGEKCPQQEAKELLEAVGGAAS